MEVSKRGGNTTTNRKEAAALPRNRSWLSFHSSSLFLNHAYMEKIWITIRTSTAVVEMVVQIGSKTIMHEVE